MGVDQPQGLENLSTVVAFFFFNDAQINNQGLESYFPQNQTPKTINRYPFNKKEYTTFTNEEEPPTIHTNIRRSCAPPRDTSVLDSGQPNHKPRKDLKKLEDANNCDTELSQEPSQSFSTSRKSFTTIPPGNNERINWGKPLKDEKQRVTHPITP